MDLKAYYRKIRQTEATLDGPHVIVVSQESPDGGRAGVRMEVPRAIAAKMLVEGRARLATTEEASQYREQLAEAKRAADQAAAAQRMQFTVVSDTEPRKRKGKGKG